MNTMAEEIFATIQNDPNGASYDFTTEQDMDNIASMHHFIEEHDLGDFVKEDDGTLVILEHDDYDFCVALDSYGLGDFFTHGIGASRLTDEETGKNSALNGKTV